MSEDRVAITGIGEVPTGIFPERSALSAAVEAAAEAIENANVNQNEIDMMIVSNSFFDSVFNAELLTGILAEELGLQNSIKIHYQTSSGGSTSSNHLFNAMNAIKSGNAGTVLCVQSEKWGSSFPEKWMDSLAIMGTNGEFEVPFGINFNGMVGLFTERYMHETGTTKEQLASVCVSQRKWAELNPHAMFRKPLTIKEVIDSKMVASPLHALECNVLADGAHAFVVTSEERAKDTCSNPVFVLGKGSIITHHSSSQCSDITRFGWKEAATQAFNEAQITCNDVDIVEIYDSYPVFNLIVLEETGFCNRGEAGEFVLQGNTWPNGCLPMTTNGGMLSQGHTGTGGGFAVLLEAVRQLKGQADERQVKEAKVAMSTSTGGSYVDAYVTLLGRE